MIETVLTPVIVAMLIKIGGKLIDRHFPDSTQSGQAPSLPQPQASVAVGFTDRPAQRSLIPHTPSRSPQKTTVVGQIRTPTEVDACLTGNEVAFVIVADEGDETVDFLTCDPDEGFQLQLPDGAYSFLAFLVDEDDENPLDSRVHALGFAGLKRLNTGRRCQLNLIVDQALDPPWWLSDLLGVESDENGYTDEDE